MTEKEYAKWKAAGRPRLLWDSFNRGTYKKDEQGVLKHTMEAKTIKLPNKPHRERVLT